MKVNSLKLLEQVSEHTHSLTTYWSYFIFYFKYLSYFSQQFLARPGRRSGDIAHTTRAAARPTVIPSQNILTSPRHTVPFKLLLSVTVSLTVSLFLHSKKEQEKGKERQEEWGEARPVLVFRIRAKHLLDKIYYCTTCCFSTRSASAIVTQILKLSLWAKWVMRGQGQGNLPEWAEGQTEWKRERA